MGDEEFYDVEKILDKRYNSRKKTWEYFIKWENYSESENTWEPESNLESIPDILRKFNKKFEKNLNQKKKLQKAKLDNLSKRKASQNKSEVQKKADVMKAGSRANKRLDRIVETEENVKVAARPSRDVREDMLELISQTPQKNQIRPNMFADLEIHKPILNVDEPVRIIGCFPKGNDIFYAVLFRIRPGGTLPSIGHFSHSDLLEHIPQLLGNYLLENISVQNIRY